VKPIVTIGFFCIFEKIIIMNKLTLLLICLLSFSISKLYSQEEVDTTATEEEYLETDFHLTPAEYPGGEDSLLRFIMGNVRYPAEAQDKRKQGVVMVKFVVEKDGTIGEVKILKGVYPSIDEEAIRVIKSLPNFIPAKKNGEKVRAWFRLPIRFTLQ
jgi:TonB family protein